MARARNIKPGFFRNADLADLSVEARLLFIGLWTLADRAGRLADRPKQIKMEIYPADNFDIEELLVSLDRCGLIRRYAVDGGRYIQVTNFAKHQNPHCKEPPSTIPEPGSTVQEQCKHGASTVQAGLIPDSGFRIPDDTDAVASERAQDDAHPDGSEPTGAHRKTSGTPKRAAQLPDDFEPNDTCAEIAAQLGVSVYAELPKFRDYHAARGKPMRDWQAAFRTWLRNAKQFAARSPPANREESRRIAASTRLSDYRAACAAEQDRDHERTIESTVTRRLG